MKFPQPTIDRDQTHDDPRPRFAIGHINLPVRDVSRAVDFYRSIGMRFITDMGQAAILELRGGTHVIVYANDAERGSLDLIVDDIDETHALLADAGASPSEITRGFPHDRFRATDTEGNALIVASNHAMGPV